MFCHSKTSSIYINFEHFASNGAYFKKEINNPNYCVSLMIFQRYTSVILRNFHPLRLWMYLTIVTNTCYFYFLCGIMSKMCYFFMWHNVYNALIYNYVFHTWNEINFIIKIHNYSSLIKDITLEWWYKHFKLISCI
jgi:hypothetical protein